MSEICQNDYQIFDVFFHFIYIQKQYSEQYL